MKEASVWLHWSEPSLWIAAASIAFNPTFWNIVARKEYHEKFLTRIAGGNSRLACYALAATIFFLGLLRDYLFNEAIKKQPVFSMLEGAHVKLLAVALFAAGNVFVLTSMYSLGITGTYLGDYFGILMDRRVTGFPFNVMEHPMYTGATMAFLGTALWNASPAGIALTLVVHFVYQFAMMFEGPFTTMIYAKRDADVQRQKSRPKKA